MERTPPESSASRSIGKQLGDVLDAERAGGGYTPLEVARARAFEALFGGSPQTRNLGRYVVLERIGAGVFAEAEDWESLAQAQEWLATRDARR